MLAAPAHDDGPHLAVPPHAGHGFRERSEELAPHRVLALGAIELDERHAPIRHAEYDCRLAHAGCSLSGGTISRRARLSTLPIVLLGSERTKNHRRGTL